MEYEGKIIHLTLTLRMASFEGKQTLDLGRKKQSLHTAKSSSEYYLYRFNSSLTDYPFLPFKRPTDEAQKRATAQDEMRAAVNSVKTKSEVEGRETSIQRTIQR